MDEKLDILGRLLGCASQLDMFMTSHEVMTWYLKQFLSGNYSFRDTHNGSPTSSDSGANSGQP